MNRKLPGHIGIIMDGNRRWAKERGSPLLAGHKAGAEKIKEVCQWCKARGVKILTLYAFSSENWDRPPREVKYLMGLLRMCFEKEIDNLHKEGIRIRVIGEKERFSSGIQKAIQAAETLTQDNDVAILNLALSYTGREEIVRAIREIMAEGILSDNVTQEMVSDHLYTAGLPDPDLIIRTSGEQRLSGFLPWQSAYSELYFCKRYWPDFREADFDEALLEYAYRQRRFGR